MKKKKREENTIRCAGRIAAHRGGRMKKEKKNTIRCAGTIAARRRGTMKKERVSIVSSNASPALKETLPLP